MRLVKVSPIFYQKCKDNNTIGELLHNERGRPCVLLVRLKYKGKNRDFVVPLRSNISGNTPKNQYFPLPPNSNTRQGNHHGVHYYKIFPVDKKYIQNYVIGNNNFLLLIKSILDKNEKEIVSECQKYLGECESGKKNFVTPDIDGILGWLYPNE